MSEYINIQGATEIKRALSELPVKLEAKLLRAALKAGAQVILVDVQARTPVRQGALRASERVSVTTRRGVVHAKIISGGKRAGADVFYANWVERGTKPHLIRAKLAKRLRIGGVRATVLFPIKVQHPGARAKPFMAPALAAKATEAVNAVAAYLRTHLAEAVK